VSAADPGTHAGRRGGGATAHARSQAGRGAQYRSQSDGCQ
jgi:hypothetical protein